MTSDERSKADTKRAQLLKGVAELALLSLLADGALYGLEMVDRLRADAGVDLAEGTIYPLLHRLQKAGLMRSEWRVEQGGAHPRKYYVLTDLGRQELSMQLAEWRQLTAALNAFLDRGIS